MDIADYNPELSKSITCLLNQFVPVAHENRHLVAALESQPQQSLSAIAAGAQ